VDRTDAIKETYGALAGLMGWDALEGKRVTKTFAAEKIIEGLREVHGVSDLRRLRSELIKHAIRDLEPEKWPQESGERD
jgi:hypothetical protein